MTNTQADHYAFRYQLTVSDDHGTKNMRTFTDECDREARESAVRALKAWAATVGQTVMREGAGQFSLWHGSVQSGYATVIELDR